ncbi:hypothetical protein O6H91_15G067500 [Diphasiastrum complanatum]|uniref:Uncharacterized protein n=1 Tax=Diphasiastrum complanatum TaxID=34168 RepID=A0ACC2BJ52_DIPCM|nr:hypothetical protein O6H91_15G067500 [Diphasiastrum complanatum]
MDKRALSRSAFIVGRMDKRALSRSAFIVDQTRCNHKTCHHGRDETRRDEREKEEQRKAKQSGGRGSFVGSRQWHRGIQLNPFYLAQPPLSFRYFWFWFWRSNLTGSSSASFATPSATKLQILLCSPCHHCLIFRWLHLHLVWCYCIICTICALFIKSISTFWHQSFYRHSLFWERWGVFFLTPIWFYTICNFFCNTSFSFFEDG